MDGDRSALDAFLARHGPLDLAWREGRLRWLRWGCAGVATIILLGFTQSAQIGLVLRFVEVALGVTLLGAFVWLRRATPAGGSVRVDEAGLRILPDGPHVAPDDIAAIALEDAGRVLVLRSRSAHDHAVPLRVRMVGHEGRIRLPRDRSRG